mgnify:FL=1
MHLSPAAFALAILVAIVGGTVQGTIGFGINLIAVPLIGLLQPAAVPGAFYVIGLPVSLTMAYREREHIDWEGVWQLLAGRVPGTVAGLLLLTWLAASTRLIAVGALVVVAAAASARAPRIRLTRRVRVGAGVVTGITGTLAGVDGPALAIVHQHEPPQRLRPTFAVVFATGGVMSLVVASAQGSVEWWHVELSTALMPGLFLGLALAGVVRDRIDAERFRSAVLTFVFLGGISAVIRGLML